MPLNCALNMVKIVSVLLHMFTTIKVVHEYRGHTFI